MADYDINISGSNATITGSSLENALGEANFQVDIDSAPDEVNRGDTATVTAITFNGGEAQDTQTVELVVDSVTEDSVSLTLDSGSGSSDDYLWDTTGKSRGDYSALIESDDDSDSATITVLKPLDSLESRYNFEDGAGASTLTDVVGNNDLDINGVDMSVSGPSGAGKAGEADGTDNICKDVDILSGDSATVSAWTRTTAMDGSENVYLIDLRTNVKFIIGWRAGSFLDGELGVWLGSWNQTGEVINDGNWHHIAVTIDNASGDVIIYVDGSQVYTFGDTLVDSTASGQPSIFSSILGGAFWEGAVDEIRFYQEALSSSQVNDLYNNPTEYLG